MAESADVVVIGAGVVGLACAAALAERGRDVLVLERHDLIGSETSSRNSEVIHAGIYYPTGSQKAALCVAGKHALYHYCESHGIPFRRCGKIIVASRPQQVAVLEGYERQARANGVDDLRWLDADEVGALEPEVRAFGGLLSPSTGVVDSHAFMLSLQGRLEAAGGMIAFGCSVGAIDFGADGLEVDLGGERLRCHVVVNAAGLEAPDLAARLDPGAPRAFFARGHYFGYTGKPPFSRLVYPVAEPGGLGVHVTLDLAGRVKFGPDVEWCDGVDYTFDATRRERFAQAIRAYYPGVDEQRLQPDYVGVRPKISGPGEPAADFRLDGEAAHGIAGLINLLGIESPGLTASLAIADRVVSMVDREAS